MSAEDRDTRIRRLKLRSWRRGTREMDLILGPFADAHLADLSDRDLAEYEALLEENDPDLYAWISESAAVPERLRRLIRSIADFARTRHGDGSASA